MTKKQTQKQIAAQVNREHRQQMVEDSCRLTMLLKTRAGKLLAKGKPFIVVAIDESYFAEVYRIIRTEEKRKGSWSEHDESRFWNTMNDWADGEWAAKRNAGGE